MLLDNIKCGNHLRRSTFLAGPCSGDVASIIDYHEIKCVGMTSSEIPLLACVTMATNNGKKLASVLESSDRTEMAKCV